MSPLLGGKRSLRRVTMRRTSRLVGSRQALCACAGGKLFATEGVSVPHAVHVHPEGGISSGLGISGSYHVKHSFRYFRVCVTRRPSTSIERLSSMRNVGNKTILLAVRFIRRRLRLTFLHRRGSSRSIVSVFSHLCFRLEVSVFVRLFPILLTSGNDRFSGPSTVRLSTRKGPQAEVFCYGPDTPCRGKDYRGGRRLVQEVVPGNASLKQCSRRRVSFVVDRVGSCSQGGLKGGDPCRIFRFRCNEGVLSTFRLRGVPTSRVVLDPRLLGWAGSGGTKRRVCATVVTRRPPRIRFAPSGGSRMGSASTQRTGGPRGRDFSFCFGSSFRSFVCGVRVFPIYARFGSTG